MTHKCEDCGGDEAIELDCCFPGRREPTIWLCLKCISKRNSTPEAARWHEEIEQAEEELNGFLNQGGKPS